MYTRKRRIVTFVLTALLLALVASILAVPALVPQDARAQGCVETIFTGLANTRQNELTDCIVLIASPKDRYMTIFDDINFTNNPVFALWENTTIRSQNDKPIDIRFEQIENTPGGSPGPWDLWFRTLTLNNVNLDPGGVTFKFPDASDTALTLENASVNLEAKPVWPSGSQLTLEVIGGFGRAHPNAPRVAIGDLSRPNGGDFGPQFGSIGHASHQNGLDVDVYYPRLDRRVRPPDGPGQVDRRLAQELVDRFVAAGAEKVFVGPSLDLRGPSDVVVPLVHHDSHLHARLPLD